MREGRAREMTDAMPWSASALACALAIALGAGCFSDRGVVIEVDIGDTRAIEVELYLGKTKCEASNAAGIDCTAIAPPESKVALDGTIWFRDDVTRYRADVNGRTATFHLTAASPTTLPIVIAVGRALTPLRPVATGAATLRDLEIPVNRGRIVTVELVATSPVVAEPLDKNLSEDRVREWGKAMPESSCVVVEHWDHGQPTRDFIVPAEDPDCDDVQKPECNPAAYHGAGIVGGAPIKPDCVVDGAQACVLGNGCSDDAPGAITECTALPRQLCVPGALCSCTSLAGDCVRDTVANDPTVPRIDCEVPTTEALGMCSGDNSAAIDMTVVPEYFGRSCGRQPLLASLQATGFSTTRSFAGAVFELSGAGDQCKFSVTWKSGSPRPGAAADHGFVVLETQDGALFVPIAFRFQSVPACATDMKCVLLDTPDSMWSCVQ